MNFVSFLASLMSLFPIIVHAQEDLRFYTVSFSPRASITRFQSTLVIPTEPKDRSVNGNVQGIWPGLKPALSQSVLQNVVSNNGRNSAEWWYYPFVCCNPAKVLKDQSRVRKGDLVTTNYVIDPKTGIWNDNWSITRNGIAPKAGRTSSTDHVVWNPKDDSSTNNQPYTQAVLAIETQLGGVWNLGPVEWRDVTIEAKGTDTAWCKKPFGSKNMAWSSTQPIARTSNGVTTCFIKKVLMKGPER